ncbi:MAG: GIY-YIG nuclease family protein [Bacteroidetes bacterium]|nr:GIY-YIG nuclease family protein [Bacteroidota bacterium]
MFYCYILKSLKDSRHYIGFTSNLEERLKKHNAGGVKSTRSRVPFVIIYAEQFESKVEAFRREQFFKSFEGRKWLHANKIIWYLHFYLG